MMKTTLRLLNQFGVAWIWIVCSLHACTQVKDCCTPTSNKNYLPLAIGNYWRVDADNYMEVIGKTNLNGNEYFVLSSYIKEVPNPVFSKDTFYLRIDEQNNLIQGSKLNPKYTEVIANFDMVNGAEVQGSVGTIRVIERIENRIQFRHDCLVCSFFPTYYFSTYLKDIGFAGRSFIFSRSFGLVKPFKEARINGVIYQL
jgi:hypothetical protein